MIIEWTSRLLFFYSNTSDDDLEQMLDFINYLCAHRNVSKDIGKFLGSFMVFALRFVNVGVDSRLSHVLVSVS